MKGYAGKITSVDLTTGIVQDEFFGEGFARKFLGGNGFAAKVLCDRVPQGADPLGPENAFILCSGPLTGTLAHGSGRCGIVTKSPLTGYFMDSYFGGEFGATLKRSGRDMIVVVGRSDAPVVLFCDDDRVSLLPARDLWGKTTKDTQDRIAERLGKGVSTVCCGPAGENQGPMACSISGRRAAGRGGTGAVLGAKNLKAITVRGTKDVQVADMKGLLAFYGQTREKFLALDNLVRLGTPFLVDMINKAGGLGSRNWQEEIWEGADKIRAERLLEGHFVRNWGCFACNLGGCTRVVRSAANPAVLTEGPEYETLFALGANCAIDDLNAIIEADRLCDDYGLDTISYGGSIAFLMECFQRGLLRKEDTGGLDFSFGSAETMVQCTHLVAKREGFGDFVAQGVKAMAEKIGGDARRFACHIKGLEPPGHSGRALKSMGLGYAVSTRGGSHHDIRPGPEYKMSPKERLTIEGKVAMAFNTANGSAIGDSLILCRFCEAVYGGVLTQTHVDLINWTVGWDMTLEELTEIACRVHTLERHFNCREGLRRRDDILPHRFMNEEIPSGPSKGLRTTPADLQAMLDDYYDLRGWDRDGVPRKETLVKLRLGDLLTSHRCSPAAATKLSFE
jgi:aldehyde:ferredoxin oxidoreductase